MANIINNNFHSFKLKVNYDEYWDFFINHDYFSPYDFNNNEMHKECLASYIDISNPKCIDDEWICSDNDYVWDDSYSSDYTLNNIGYTSVDNGLIRFRKDRISNKDFLELYTNSKFDIKENDKRLKLHQVSGNTLQYVYPSEIVDDALKLNGGFYQGFFKTECDKYQILPSSLDDVWHFEFVLKKEDFDAEINDKTLNSKYPNNKGIFFYIGTRAENKWIYLYDKEDECDILSYDDYIENSHIDKNDYIIGNFYDPNPDFDGYELNFEDYINDKYFSPKLYENNIDECAFETDNYIDFEEAEKPNIIDENKYNYSIIGWGCNDTNVKYEYPNEYVHKYNNCFCTPIKKEKHIHQIMMIQFLDVLYLVMTTYLILKIWMMELNIWKEN